MKTANILCGAKGSGKSEYSIKKWPKHLLLECDIPFLGSTYSIINYMVYNETGRQHTSNENLLLEFVDILNIKTGIIIDNAELIDNDTLKLIVNIAKQKDKDLVFIFDLPYKKLHNSNVFLTLLEWNMINIDDELNDFKIDLKTLRDFVFMHYPYVQSTELEKIMKIAGYNFNEIKKIMWLNKTFGANDCGLTDEVINIYLKKWLEKEVANISPQLVDILKKSSIVGEVFEKHPLEHENGFNILGVSNYLEELENQEIFISKCIPEKDSFKFINSDVYNAVLASISSPQKNEWYSVLKEYYIKIFSYSNNEYVKLESLVKAKNAAEKINDYLTIFEINKVLLFKYMRSNNFLKATAIIDEIISDTYISKDQTYIDYLLSLKIKILIDLGEFGKALEIVENRIEDSRYTGSYEYLKYFHIKCLFGCGKIDLANSEATKLVKRLKASSKSGNMNQKIYPLTYSIMASIQNHLGLEDDGLRFYRLALNYANNLIDDKTLYYDILSRCDMFLSGDFACCQLLKCIDYFTKTNNKLKLGKTYVNLATEMLFEGCGTEKDIEMYLFTAKNTFIVPDENLAYVKNNLAIYYILAKNDFISAIEELESALFVNLSEFTYMTIFLNLAMCYFVVDGRSSKRFNNAYRQFIKFEETIANRKNATKYEYIYRTICDLIVLNKSSDNIQNICDKHLSTMQSTDFFYPILQDIKNRACSINKRIPYQRNCNYYRIIHEKGIFLAEFRFWE